MNIDAAQFRLLPSLDALLHSVSGRHLLAAYGRPATVSALRTTLEQARAGIRAGQLCPPAQALLTTAQQQLEREQRPQLLPVINATGVIINTNLGRAPLSQEALEAVRAVAQGYTNLEYDLLAGVRGARHGHIAALLRGLVGAQAALVTNNNAAAVLLALSTLAAGREVVISRGQLVEIGGGFRVPDVMRQSGCRLVEVGTTNRTRLSDYKEALTAETALLLVVHPSNFQISGFVETTPLSQLASLAQQQGLLLMEDQGSGCLLACERYHLAHEPVPQESLAAGADLVCFSGDKLLGGPQAGILVGRAAIIEQISRHPLMRALRVDKMTLAALEATLRHYQRAEATTCIPIWRMISAAHSRLAERADTWVRLLDEQGVRARLQCGQSTIGGGSLPGETLPTTLLALDAAALPLSLEEIARRLRTRPIPVVARIQHAVLLLDPRTVLEEQDVEVVRALVEVITARN
ncbi:MAG TPA: L-seryl-tRNA(Sec) selenium transferase [Ktedonobacteraceae bacterium]|jgi:L-seryl-tRNA(Ser) seleniumtransferase